MITNNHYVAAEVVVLGSGRELVRGSINGILFDDGPGQERRNIEIEDVE
jgi:hypothetical protein